jgi:hypothetical protein
MAQSRRDFLSGSIAVFTVSKAGAEAAPPGPPRRIGLVTSITFDQVFQDCFFNGLAFLGWHRTPPNPNIILPMPPGGQNPGEAQGRYGTGPMGHAGIQNLIRVHGNNVDLIVVAGGLTSQAAALEELQPAVNPPDIPFVYLAGHSPPAPPAATPPGKYCGAVMNISALYPGAVSALVGLGVNRDGVWLVENGNSDFSNLDCSDWLRDIGNDHCLLFFADPHVDNPAPPDANIRNAYRVEIAKLQAKHPTGVVVSPDPYFRSTAQILADEMRNALGNIPIFYPFSDFLRSANDRLVPNVPKLSSDVDVEIPNTAYYQLGLAAGRVLSSSTSANRIPPMQILSRIWTQSNPPPPPWMWIDMYI